MFQRFTEGSRRVVVLAQEEARMLDHNHIGTEHLLLGLIHEQSGIAARVLASAGITLEAARAQVGEMTDPVGSPQMGHIPFTQRAKKILELSLREALEQNKGYIGTEHLLLGLLRDADGVGAQIIERLGGSLSALRQQVLDLAPAEPSDAAAPEPAAASTWETNPEPGARGSRPAHRLRWEALGQAQTIAEFWKVLTSLDQRLAGIERHLGLTADEAAAGGFRGLLTSVDRRLASIEHHFGLTADEPPKTAD